MGNFLAWKTYLTVHRKGDYAAAMAGYNKAYQTGITSPGPLAAYGVLLLRNGEYQKAQKIFDDLLLKPINAEQRRLAIINRALCRWKLGFADEAVETLTKLHEQAPSRLTYGCLGYVLFAVGQLDQAWELSLQAVDYCQDPVFYDTLGQICFVRGDYQAAAPYFEQALDLKPDQADSLYHLAVILHGRGENERAVDLLQEALNSNYSTLATVTRAQVEATLAQWQGE